MLDDKDNWLDDDKAFYKEKSKLKIEVKEISIKTVSSFFFGSTFISNFRRIKFGIFLSNTLNECSDKFVNNVLIIFFVTIKRIQMLLLQIILIYYIFKPIHNRTGPGRTNHGVNTTTHIQWALPLWNLASIYEFLNEDKNMIYHSTALHRSHRMKCYWTLFSDFALWRKFFKLIPPWYEQDPLLSPRYQGLYWAKKNLLCETSQIRNKIRIAVTHAFSIK